MHMGNIPFILLKGLMMKTELTCPKCGAIVEKYLNPKPTVDIVIHDRERGLVLVDRKNPPYGNALPGGFIDQASPPSRPPSAKPLRRPICV